MDLAKKHIGVILVAISLFLAVLTYSFTSSILAVEDASCPLTGTIECPHAGNLPWQSYLSYTLCVLLFALGLFLYFSKEETNRGHSKKVKMTNLDKEEKKLVLLINESHGTIFQSELVEKSGFDKVKVTRILDRLEGKGAIERRRRGMTNVVLVK